MKPYKSLRGYKGKDIFNAYPYYYIATPYSKYPDGVIAAENLALEQTAFFMRCGIPCVSPIVHSCAIARASGIDHTDSDFWLQQDRPLLEGACGLIVICANGWEDSHGIKKEIRWAKRSHKLIYYTDPKDQSDTIFRICTYYPVHKQTSLYKRRRIALSVTYAYKKDIISFEDWKTSVTRGKHTNSVLMPLDLHMEQEIDAEYEELRNSILSEMFSSNNEE